MYRSISTFKRPFIMPREQQGASRDSWSKNADGEITLFLSGKLFLSFVEKYTEHGKNALNIWKSGFFVYSLSLSRSRHARNLQIIL